MVLQSCVDIKACVHVTPWGEIVLEIENCPREWILEISLVLGHLFSMEFVQLGPALQIPGCHQAPNQGVMEDLLQLLIQLL